STTSNALNGAFHHLAGTFNPTAAVSTTGMKLFVDGVQIDSTTAIPAGFTINYNPTGGLRHLYLGRLNGTGCTLPFAGTLDEARIWSRALTAGEVFVSSDMSNQVNPASELGHKGESDGAKLVYTKKFERTDGANPQIFNFDMVTADPALVFTTCTVG